MTIIYFILILGITVFVHEFGHFIFAKRAGIHCYEFSIGMGPIIKSWKRKNDETEYSIRLLPIGGYVSMAGETNEMDPDVPEKNRLQSKTWGQRFMTIIAGIMNNFILAIVIFFIIGLINGAVLPEAYISGTEEGYPAYESGIVAGDKIVKVDGKKVDLDMFQLKLSTTKGESTRFTVIHEDGSYDNVVITPKKEVSDKGEVRYVYGFNLTAKTEKGFIPAVKYAFRKFFSLIKQMCYVIGYLCFGKLSLSNVSGPVGIYSVVNETAKTGLLNLVYLLGYISLNVGFMNLLPIPAFDGGRLFFLVVEKIKGSKVSIKFENTVHAIGFFLLMLLMVVITYNDIIRLFIK